ncbi:MAG: AAA family ATPase [Verrucomicrobiota bacterium]|nr:AAA family ATPase [Verrucomicrobiota bacterium]
MDTALLQTHSTLNALDAFLRRRILGQDQVVPRIVSVLRRGQLGLTKAGRPRGSFLFLGPTGVGKTEITLAFTEFLMSRDRLFRFDMSEYQTQESLALLLGGNARERGTLGGVVSKTANGTLLFDEIEKAHPRILDIFLQILDAARITTASGETLDLSGFYVVFTSNIGSAELMNLQHSSFATMERHVLTRAQQSLRPELYARITEKLVFNRLSYDIQLDIARLLLDEELKFLRAQGHELTVAKDVLSFIVRRGFHPRLGARPMRDAVEKLVGDAVAEQLLSSAVTSGKLLVHDNAERLRIEATTEADEKA